MRTASKFLSVFLCFVLVSLVLTIFGTDSCKSRSQIIIVVPNVESANLTSEQARRVTRVVRNEVACYGTVRNSSSTSGADMIVTGLASRADNVYLITLRVEDLNNGGSKQTTKNLRGSFEDFLNKKVRSAVHAIMR